jgi:hypothetical protein
MEIKGIIHLMGDRKQVTDNMQKQEVVIQTQEQYPQFIKVEFINTKCDLLNGLGIGNDVTVSINLRGNLSRGGETSYNSIQGWKVSKN